MLRTQEAAGTPRKGAATDTRRMGEETDRGRRVEERNTRHRAAATGRGRRAEENRTCRREGGTLAPGLAAQGWGRSPEVAEGLGSAVTGWAGRTFELPGRCQMGRSG